MGRAGARAYRLLRQRWPQAQNVTIICGPGNNGGDGYIIAALAAAAGLTVNLIGLGDPDTAEAQKAKALAQDAGLTATPYAPGLGIAIDAKTRVDLVVDALLGIGFHGELRLPYGTLIGEMNNCDAPCLSVDIPSGLEANTGAAKGPVIRASATITFIAPKLGLFTGQGPAVTGEVFFDDLDVATACERETYEGVRLGSAWVQDHLPCRNATFHKGRAGHALIIGAGPGMPGAAVLAGKAALRMGAGRVTVGCHPDNVGSITAYSPELMARGISEARELHKLLGRVDVTVIGPGLGLSEWAQMCLSSVMERKMPKIFDADALNLLAQSPQRVPGAIVTPHPAEAARLLGCDTVQVEMDRPGAGKLIAERFGAVCVLKGAGTLVCDRGAPLLLCDRGNPGMATAGMGDVLSGVIGALHAQGLDARVAAGAGTWLHSAAGDLAAARGGAIGLMAGDLMGHLRLLRNAPEKADGIPDPSF